MKTNVTGRTAKIWRDGQLVAWEDATIHVMSHVVHYGSSVVEGLRCYETPSGGAIFRARDHMRRLTESCKIYRLPLTYGVDELVQACVDTVAANDLRQCYLRPVVVRTGEHMGISPVNAPTETFIIAWTMGTYFGHQGTEGGVDVCVSSWRRPAPDTFPAMAKAGGNYLNSQLTKMEARGNQYAEGIMLDVAGFVAEGSGENVFAVRDGVLYTSPLSSGILNGITRDSLIRLAEDLGIPVREQLLPREFLYVCDELFMCGTAAEITPVRSVDHLQVGTDCPGPITRALQREFLGIAKGALADRHEWLTMVPEAVAAK